MIGLSVAPKLVGESRLEALDISAALGPADIPQSAAVTVAVYSGVDPSPSSLVGSPTVDTVYNLVYLPLLVGGLAGCLYQLVITLTLATGYNKTFTLFLAVLPDAV